MISVHTYLRVLVVGQVEDVFDEGVNVHHEGLRAADDELVDAGDGVRPDLGAAVLEELQELWHEHVERPVDLVLGQLYKTRSSRKIDSRRLFTRE